MVGKRSTTELHLCPWVYCFYMYVHFLWKGISVSTSSECPEKSLFCPWMVSIVSLTFGASGHVLEAISREEGGPP